MRLIRAGEPAAAVLAGHGAGEVLAVFRRAVYLNLPRGLIALVAADAEPGPLHVLVTALPPAAAGDPVRAGGELSVAGSWLRGTPVVWRPGPLPDPARAGGLLRRVLDHEPDLDLAGGPGAAGERPLCALLRRHGLAAAVPVLGGRGAGLTPAGDDVLAGLLMAARAAGGPRSERRLVGLARRVRTHAISLAFLEQAARGRSIAALHDLVDACARGDLAGARRARARLAGVGHTSGLDLAYGMLIGATTGWRRH
jgi:hypothetical protein